MVDFIIKQIKKNKILIKFGVSGSITVIIDFSLLYFLHGVQEIGLRISASIAFVASFFVSFYMQKLWTFKGNENKKTHKQMMMFFGVGIFNVAINAWTVPYLVSEGIYYLIAQAMSAVVLSIGSFVMYKYVIFKKSHKDLKKKNLFRPDKFNGLRVLIAVNEYNREVKNLRSELRGQGDRVKIITYAENENDESGIYKICNKRNIVSRLFEYFYHVYKIVAWSDIVYARGNLENLLLVFLVCKIRRENYIFELSENFIFQNKDSLIGGIKKKIIQNAKLIIIRDAKLRSVTLNSGAEEDSIIVLDNDENIRISEYLL